MTTTAVALTVGQGRGPRGARRSPWPGFLARRIGSFLLSLWLILTLVFFLVRSVGADSIRASAGLTATPEYIAGQRAAFGLDQPLIVQYGAFLRRIASLDFGTSISTGQPVFSEISTRLPYTLQLGMLSFVAAVIVSIPLGIAIAAHAEQSRGKAVESTFNGVTGFFASVPDYLIAVSLVLVFAVALRWLPAAGGSGPTAYILPVITVSLGLIAILSRLVKTEASRVLKEDYVRTARANRLPSRVILGKHVLPNVLTATITYAGLMLATLLGGTIITETVFAWPGVGNLLVKAIAVFDFTLLEGIVVVIATFALLITLVVDVLLGIVDPKSLILRS